MRRIIIFLSIFCQFSFVYSGIDNKEIRLYVSANGSDNNSGTQKSPLKSLEKARDTIRFLKKKNQGATFIVFIEGGIYSIDSPLIFTSEDSGTESAPIIYRAEDGMLPVFTGSKILANWTLLEDKKKLDLLDASVRNKIFKINLKDLGILDFGDPTEPGARPELFCNGERQILARWPNEGFVHAGLVKGPTKIPPDYLNKTGSREGIFEYLDGHQNRWIKENDIRLGGYWHWDWSDEYHKVDRIDTISKIISVMEPYHTYGYRDSLRYFGLNLFCEIDQPGEWYLDRNDGVLYWFPPVGIIPDKAKVTLTVFKAPYMIEFHDCSYLTIKGLAFQESRGSAILIEGGKNCMISGCHIERFGRDGIHIEGGFGHGISRCLLCSFGCSGIKINGGDRKNLIPANHFVEHTIVEHFSLFKRTYEPAVLMAGCGIRLSNNRFQYSSSSAIRMEGNDFLIEYNEIRNVVNESDDQGGLDIWYNPSYRGNVIRYNHWADIYGGTHHGAAGVRLDDMISGVNIYGNIFERCGALEFGAVQIHGGKDNIVENNIFYKCNAAVSFSSWGESRWLKTLDSPIIQTKLYEEVDIRSPLYESKYPELKDIRKNPDINTVKNNMMIDCKNQFLRKNVPQIEKNNTSLHSGGKSIEYFYSARLLKKYGLQPIPIGKIGPQVK